MSSKLWYSLGGLELKLKGYMLSSREPLRNSQVISIRQGEILDYPAEHLICSGNHSLNMSGGVNGALLQRYGEQLQLELHDYLAGTGARHVPPGFCYRWATPIGNYKGVTYSVAIDALYESSQDLVIKTILTSLDLLQPRGLETVAFPALATGYGKLSKWDFGLALRSLTPMLAEKYPGTHFVLVGRNGPFIDEIKEASGIS